MDEFGNDIKPHLLKIWAQAKNLAKEVKPEERQEFSKTDKTNLSPKEKFDSNMQEAKFAKEGLLFNASFASLNVLK
jgi:site-specific DNA-adenine methylase